MGGNPKKLKQPKSKVRKRSFDSPQVSFLAAGGNSAALMTLASLLRRRWPHLVYEDVLKTAQVASETDLEKMKFK